MNRREFLKGAAATVGAIALPELIFAAEKPRTVLFDSGYQPAYGRMKIYSDMTWERYTWLGLGHMESGAIEDGKFVITKRERVHPDAIGAFSV